MSFDTLLSFLDDSPAVPGSAFEGRRGEVVPSYHPTLKVTELLGMFRSMVLSRLLDERELLLQKQMKCWFSIFAAGKEAAQVAAGLALRPTDPIWGYYRDRAICIQRGITPEEMLLQAVASADDPASSGRQMPAHFGHRDKAVVVQGSPTGYQSIPSVGLAEALAKTKSLLGAGTWPADAVVYSSIGDASTAEGEFYEALRAAILGRAPVVFHLQDDGFGISVPAEEQVPGEDVLALFRNWPGLRVMDVDGTDLRASYDAFVEAAAHARSRRGPVLLRARVLRLMSHSSTDDMRKYREGIRIAQDLERDPLPKFARELLAFGVATVEELRAIADAARTEVEQASERSHAHPKVDTAALLSDIYAYEPATARAAWKRAVGDRKSAYAGRVIPLADAVNHALHELMAVDPRIVMWGEDIADLSRRTMERAPELKGKGGVFGITAGLQREFGSDRVSNSPIAEATIVGRAVGHALQGFRPIVEVQFRDYLNPAWQQVVDQAGTMRWRSGGRFNAPFVVRMSYGGYLGGAGAVWHSESANGPLLHHPGLRLCVPGNARDAVALLRASAFCDDVVLYMEPKAIYRRNDAAFGLEPGSYMDQPYPDLDEACWPGSSRTYGDGRHLAILSYGNTAALSLGAVRDLAKKGIRARFVDLRWLNPLDEKAILAAADECGHVLVVDEDRRTCGAGAAVADVIYRDRDLRRRVDVERVAAIDSRVCYGPIGEAACLPQLEWIVEAATAQLRGRLRPPTPRNKPAAARRK